MTTNEQREFAGVSPVDPQALPRVPKQVLDDRRDEAKLHRIEAKELREFNQPMVEYNYHKELTDTLWNPRDIVMNQLKKWNYRIISPEEDGESLLHTPYRHLT